MARDYCFLFTDVEGSSALWERDRAAMSAALRLHNSLVGAALTSHGGRIFKATGDGFCAVFEHPDHAVSAAIACQAELDCAAWPGRTRLRVRMGIHVGRAQEEGGDFTGPALSRAARVTNLGHGGQVLVSRAIRDALADSAAENFRLIPLGAYELRGLGPEEIFQISHPSLQDTFPPLRAAVETGPHPLLQLAEERPFVGREDERQEVARKLLEREQGLVTITGIGGAGKTRLAKQVAADLLNDFDGNVHFVECDPLISSQELLVAIARELGIEGEGATAIQSITDAIQGKRTLLVLDCFEKLLDAGPTLDAILKSSRSIRCLVTSRAVLGLPREFEYPLGPMGRSKQGGGPSDGELLFAEAASHILSAFRLTRANRRIVRDIVDLAEGIPLAIVLAAGRLRHLSLGEIASQLRKGRLDVLRRRPIGEDKHANLAGVIEGSLDLLPKEQADLATRLSVFAGGFFVSDAVSVLGDSIEVLEGISLLRDFSLLVTSVVDGKMRYRSLDSVREYLESSASPDEIAPTKRAHAVHFASRAADVRSLFDEGSWTEASALLWREVGNFRAAARHCIQNREDDLLVRLGRGLCRSYLEAGLREEFEELSRGAESAATRTLDHATLIEIRGLQGTACRRTGDIASAERHWQERVRLCALVRDFEKQADSLLDLADMMFAHGNIARARDYLKEFDAIEASLPDGAVRASGLLLKSRLHQSTGDPEEAARLFERARRIAADLRPDPKAFYVWRNMAGVYLSAGAHDSAIEMCLRMLEGALAGSYAHYAGLALISLADTLASAGRPEAEAKCLAALARFPKAASPMVKSQLRGRSTPTDAEWLSSAVAQAADEFRGMSWVEIAEAVLSKARALHP